MSRSNPISRRGVQVESPRDRIQTQIRTLQRLELLIYRQYELSLQSPEVPRHVSIENEHFASLLISAAIFFPKIDECDRLWCGSKEVSHHLTEIGRSFWLSLQLVGEVSVDGCVLCT
jgi:hypothetical protein